MDTETSPEKIAAALADIERINRFLGGRRASVRAVVPFIDAGAATILDVASGGGDVAAAFARAGHDRSGRTIRVAVVDRNPVMLAAARRAHAGLAAVAADALALPFRDRAFDVVHCSLFLHHLEPETAPLVLREFLRVARLAVVVNDLRRHRVAHWAIRALSRVAFRSALVRVDGPLSVLRAFTPDEVLALCALAGLPAPRVRRSFGFRMSIVFDLRSLRSER
jgi:ubiquinone/menaquinone biosynthesis C-methylase UbiE